MAEARGTAGSGNGLVGEPVHEGHARYCDICAKERGWPRVDLFREWGKCEVCGRVACCTDYPRPDPPVSGDRAARRRINDNLKGVFG